MKKIFFIATLVSIAFFNSCKHDPLIPEHGICFETEILPVFTANCSPCHNEIKAEKGYIFTTYENIISKGIVKGKPNKSEIFEVLDEGFHKNKVNDYQKGLIKMWIEQDAKNDITCSPSYCDSSNATYSNKIKPFFEASCNNCHYDGNTYPDLTNADSTKSYALQFGNILVQKIIDQHEAPVNKPYTSCQIAWIRNWVKNGAN